MAGLDLGASFTDVPGGTANWTFTSPSLNYNNDSGSVAIVITKASSTTVVTVNNATYDGNPHGGTANVTGVGGLNQPVTVNYAGRNGTSYGPSTTPPTNAGDYQARATFAGDANHNGSQDSKPFTINKANQTITVTIHAPASAMYNTSFTVAATGGGSGNSVTYSASGVCSNVINNFTMTSGTGTCTVHYNQAGNANYNAALEVIENVTASAWTLKGFYQPVDMNGVYNVVKGGSTVPLKFEVFAGATELTTTSVVKSFVQTLISCGTSTVLDEIEVVSTGGTSLRYDTTGGQFIQNWQTPKAPGACYRVTLTTQDNSTLVAFFKLK